MARKHLTGMPIIVGDVLRFVVDLLMHLAALLAAALAFVALWRGEVLWRQLLAFPAAYCAFVAAFLAAVLLLRLLCVRRVVPGRYSIRAPEALPWILADELWRMLQRSFLRRVIADFGPQRWFFYRLMGARIDRTFFIGWGARILDPWALEVGRDAVIGAGAVICGHVLEGGIVTIEAVRIGAGATVGVGAIVFPGVEVGPGAIVAAGAVVTKGTVIPAGEVWAGVPARKIGVVGEPENREAPVDRPQ
ncbi:MAG: hypothetical protein KAX19_06655 [Candidatus Brocadiae bacterium]|nr:hypothetical protein [Candidatus Brocadiia bacterium]